MPELETENIIRQKDLEQLAQDKIFDEYKNSTILVTGATGLIGSEIVLALLCANRLKGLNIRIVAHVRNLEKAKKIFECVLDNPNLEIVVGDICNPVKYDNKVDYIIHTANTTSSKEMLEKPVETILTIVDGTKNILNFARDKNIKSMCYLSSLEVYGNIKSEENISEDFIDCKLDLTNTRSSYPEAKRLAENLCISYAKEFDLDIKIARLTQTFGAGISKDDNRVFAQFAKSALNKTDIILHTTGETVRNYCYITDAVIGILLVLYKGNSKEVYNVSNEETAISIKKMAELIAKKYDLNIIYDTNDDNYGYNPVIKMCLDSKKLSKLGFEPKVNLEEMFERLVGSSKEQKI